MRRHCLSRSVFVSLVTALLVVGSAAVADAQCVGGTLTTSGGRDYIYCPTTLNWNAARSDCQAIGTGWDLASVTSNSENTTVRTVGGVNSDRWFGLNDKTTEGTYQWSDGTAFSYTNWATGEPNNSGDEDCVEQYGTTAGATRGRWNDLGCTSATLPFVCEAASGCGNKRISSGETCDDGNTTNGDGCSSSCAVESGWYCDSSQPSVCVAGCSGGVSSSSGGSDYLYCATTVNRATALANCSALGSTWDMVWISNSTENTYVRSLSSVAQWIGLNDITTEGTYVWDGTHTFSYSNWAASQPNNSGGGGGSDCVAQLTAGTWDDITCTSTRAFVCRSSSSGCGNGAVTGSEACDDGDTTNGDGCSSTCTVEPGYSCTGSPSICTPRCVGGKFRFRTIAGSPYTYREYFYCGVSTAWSAAETVCASLGTGWHLTNIGSSGENDYVRNLGSSTQYIGYNDVATEGTFVWSNGGAGTYTNWNSGEPNNSGGEDCTEQQTTGGWNDIACTTAYPYVCEQSDAGAICGNGVIGGSEQCDDGNKASGDGCSSTCVVEDYSCTIPVDNGAASICTVPDHVLLDGVRLLNVAGTPVLEWKTSAQAGTVGFFAARLDEGRNQWVPLHDGMLLAAVNGDAGVTYRLVDRSGSITGAHKYWLQEYDAGGHRITLSNATLSAVRDGAVTRLPAGGFETTVATRRGEPSAVGPVGGTLALRGARVPVGAVVSVPSAGVQAVTVASLASVLGRSAADVTSAIGTGHLSITDDGNDVPWTYDADASRVVFVGEASTSVYTNARPYQVSLAAGHVMAVDDATGTGAAAVGLGRVVTEVEHDTFAGLVASPDPASDYWFDAVLSAGSAKNGSYAASVGLAQVPAQDVAVEVRVFGAWNVDAQNPQHLTLLVNGEAAGAFDVSAVGAVTRTFDVPAAKFVAGKNTLSLTATSDGAPGMGGSYVDGFTLDYITELDLGADHARFEAVADGPMAAIIDGTDVRVFDVTEGREIRAAQDSVAGATEVRFVAHADHLYELVAEGGIATAATLRPSFDGGFASPDLAADLVIVAPHAMRAAADKLATARRGDGLEVEVFDLEDVVDHFAHGLPSPAAITELLRDAQGSWATAPKYVVLVGDGTFDYRHVMGVGPGAMPPALVSTSFGLYASDSSLADLDGDGVADLAVGRLPAHTAEEAMGMVNRIVAYGNLSLSDFTHDVTLAAGENRGTDFERDLDNQAAQLPIRARLNVVRSNGQSLVDARAKILAAMNEGTFWFDYVGHGGLDRLDDRGLLTAADVNALTNVDVAPVVTGMTCSISRFEVPGMPSLGDSLLLGDKGGAIAVWAPTGVSESADAGKVGLRFGKLLMQDAVKQGTVRLGDVVLRTQREAVRDGLAPKDMMSVFALLGDPSMTLPDLSGLAAEGPQTPEVVPPAPDAGTPETDGGPGPGATHDGGCAVGQGAGNSALFAVLLVAALLVIRRRRP